MTQIDSTTAKELDMPNGPESERRSANHQAEHCPHCGEWLSGKPTCPRCGKNVIDPPAGQAEQPEPKDYPINGQHGFCPLGSLYESGPAATFIKKLPPCDPANCALSIRETNQCSIKSAARTLNDMLLGAAVRAAKDAQLHQLIEQLSERLAAVLQSLAGSQKTLPDMLRYFYDSQFAERALGLETVLSYINAAVQRIAPKAKTGEPT